MRPELPFASSAGAQVLHAAGRQLPFMMRAAPAAKLRALKRPFIERYLNGGRRSCSLRVHVKNTVGFESGLEFRPAADMIAKSRDRHAALEQRPLAGLCPDGHGEEIEIGCREPVSKKEGTLIGKPRLYYVEGAMVVVLRLAADLLLYSRVGRIIVGEFGKVHHCVDVARHEGQG